MTSGCVPVAYEIHVEHFHPPHQQSGYRALARAPGEHGFVVCGGCGRTVSEALITLEQRLLRVTGRPASPLRLVYGLEP